MLVPRLRLPLLAASLLLIVACSSQPEATTAQAVAPGGAVEPSTAMLYRLAPETARLEVTATKDAAIPVTGAFEALSGLLSAQGHLWSGFVGTTTAGFRTGLEARDGTIQTAFFGNAVSRPELASKVALHWEKVSFTVPASEGMTVPVQVQATLELGPARVPMVVAAEVSRAGEDLILQARQVPVSISELGMGQALQDLISLCGHKSVDDRLLISFRGTFRPAQLALPPASSPHP